MSFRLIFETEGPGAHRYGSDRHSTAEWRHAVVFDARAHRDERDLAEGLLAPYEADPDLAAIHARLTLVVEPQYAERVLPQVNVYVDAARRPTRIDGFVHVPPSFVAALGPGAAVVARLGFLAEAWDALDDFSAGDKLGGRCSKAAAASVVVEIVGGEA